MMKRLFSFMIACAMLLIPLSALGESAREQTALRVVDAIVNGSYEEAVEYFSDELKESFPSEEVRESYEPMRQLLGEFWGVHDVQASMHGEVQLILVRCAYENSALAFAFSFEGDELSGLFFQLAVIDGVEGLEYPLDSTRRETVFLREGEWDETAARLLVPDGEGPFPAVVFLADSGAQDKDASIFANRPFYDIAEGLVHSGIASIRFEKYTYHHTSGMTEEELARLTVQEEYINDALAAIEILRADPRIGDIYVLGHGQGANVTPRVIGAAGAENIAGGILLGGTPKPLWLVSAIQNLESIPEEQKESYTPIMEGQLAIAAEMENMTEAELLEKTLFGRSAYYQKDEASVDAAAAALENKVPLLIAQGEADWEITPETGLRAWEDALKEADFRVEYRSYAQLNHLMMPQTGEVTGTVMDYMTEGEVAEEVISDIIAFILGA